jgi:glycosyltransferase involved in cell wall biosynthesis
MKTPDVLHIATYESFGGAARATMRIFEALKTQALRSQMFTLVKTSSDQNIQLVQPKENHAKLEFIHKVLKLKQKLSQKTILESFGDISAGIVDEINTHQASIIHLHWINNLLSIEDIGRINKPIVWTLHDMWPFSGSEHYNDNSNAFFYETSRNIMSSDNESSQTFELKQKHWHQQSIKYVAPSNWLANCARRSILTKKHDIKVIPHPIDFELWSPHNSKHTNGFNLDIHKKQILFVGQNAVNNPTKGWDLLQTALMRLYETSDIKFELVVVGHSGEIVSNCPYIIHSLGEILSDEFLVDLYSTVDLLVVPSRAEAFSQVTLEAQSCGLPVIGFDIGGIPDVLIHKRTGWISAAFDTVDFCEGIKWILQDEERAEKLGLEGRKNVIENFSSERVGKQYYELYKQIISERKCESKTDLDVEI